MSERDLNNTVTPNPKLAIDYCGIKMKNPIIAASGTFGNGPEYAGYLDPVSYTHLDVYKRQNSGRPYRW